MYLGSSHMLGAFYYGVGKKLGGGLNARKHVFCTKYTLLNVFSVILLFCFSHFFNVSSHQEQIFHNRVRKSCFRRHLSTLTLQFGASGSFIFLMHIFVTWD